MLWCSNIAALSSEPTYFFLASREQNHASFFCCCSIGIVYLFVQHEKPDAFWIYISTWNHQQLFFVASIFRNLWREHCVPPKAVLSTDKNSTNNNENNNNWFRQENKRNRRSWNATSKSNLHEQYWCWWMLIITFDSIAVDGVTVCNIFHRQVLFTAHQNEQLSPGSRN